MTATTPSKNTLKNIDDLFAAGLHYGYAKARRHPSARQFIFGAKSGVEVFDLEKTAEQLERAKAFVEGIATAGKQVVLVASKLEARQAIKNAGEALGLPYVAGRWVGGTLSNFAIIRKRIDRLEKLIEDREKGTLVKYTKKERLMIDREIKRLEETFGGLRPLKSLPAALVVVDPKHEKNAVAEATTLRIPIVALANSDCDMTTVLCPVPGNDSNRASVALFVTSIADAYKAGKEKAPVRPTVEEKQVPQSVGERPSDRSRLSADKAGAPRHSDR
ncbi:MAG: 30S ribosomal protein S2 [Patescibacteria group bacterium]